MKKLLIGGPAHGKSVEASAPWLHMAVSNYSPAARWIPGDACGPQASYGYTTVTYAPLEFGLRCHGRRVLVEALYCSEDVTQDTAASYLIDVLEAAFRREVESRARA